MRDTHSFSPVLRLFSGALVVVGILTLALGGAALGQNPTCVIAVGTALVCDGDRVQEVTVTYNEPMSPTPAPTVEFQTTVGTWVPVSGSWDLSQRVWAQSFTVTDANEETVGVDVAISGAQDTDGNPQVPNTLVDAFNVDTRNPNAPVITGVADDNGSSNADGVTNDNTLILNGTAEAQSTVRLYRDASLMGSSVASAGGAWTFDDRGTVLADGTYQFTATATDAAGNVSPESAQRAVLVDRQAPPAPGGRSPADGARTSDNTPTFSWTAPTDPGGSGVRDYRYQVTTTPAKDGYTANTTYTPTAVADGTYTWRVYTRDVAGNTGMWSAYWTLVVDTGVPTAAMALSDVAIYDGDVGTGRFIVTATFSEAMDPGTIPTLTFAPSLATTLTNPSGAWSVGNTVYTWTYNIEDAGVTLLDVDVTVSGARDAAGNTQVTRSQADYIDVDTQNPTVVITANDVAIYDGDVGADRFVVTATFSEAMDPATIPTLTLEPDPATTLTNPRGAWSGVNTVYAWTFDVEDAGVVVQDVDATVSGGKDLAGNAQIPTTRSGYVGIDTENPLAPSVPDLDPASDFGSSATDDITRTNTPTFTGGGEANSTIEVWSDLAGSLGTTAASGSGDWTFTVPGARSLADGAHAIRARATDMAGNSGAWSSGLAVLIDTQAPAIPGGRAPADGTVTRDNTPTFSCTAPSDPGGSGVRDYRIQLSGPSSRDYYTPLTTYTPTALADGNYTWRIYATDVAGNPGSGSVAPWSASWSFTIDTSDIEPPTTTLLSTPPNPDNNASPTLQWTGADNATPTPGLVYQTTADSEPWPSTWSSSTTQSLGPLGEGWHTFYVRAKDSSGNIGAAASYSWSLDVTAPSIWISVPAAFAQYSLNAVVLADWRATDSLGGVASAVATAAVGDPIGTAAMGLHTFAVTATDAAGNKATATVTYSAVCVVTPGADSGTGQSAEAETGFLDRPTNESGGEGGGTFNGVPLAAVYQVGDTIRAGFRLTDAYGIAVNHAVASLTVVRVTLKDGGDEHQEVLLPIGYFVNDPATGGYWAECDTESLAPGIYDLWLGLSDGTNTRLRIQLTPSSPD